MEELEVDLQKETGRRKTLQMEAINMKDAQLHPAMEVKIQCSTQTIIHTHSLSIPHTFQTEVNILNSQVEKLESELLKERTAATETKVLIYQNIYLHVKAHSQPVNLTKKKLLWL